MKSKCFILIWLFLLAGHSILFAQSEADYEEITDTTDSAELQKKDSTITDILLYPRNDDPYLYSNYHDRRQYTQNSVFFGLKGVGVESVYMPSNSSWFVGGYIAASEPGESAMRTNMITAVYAGYQAVLNPQERPGYRIDSERARPHFYLRFGPGLATTSVRSFGSGMNIQSERLIGFNMNGIIGGALPISDRSRIIAETGWRSVWFPASDELNHIGGLQFSIGLQFSFGDGVRPYSY